MSAGSCGSAPVVRIGVALAMDPDVERMKRYARSKVEGLSRAEVKVSEPRRSASSAWLLPLAIFAGLGIALAVSSRGGARVEAGTSAPPFESATTTAIVNGAAATIEAAPPPASAWQPPARSLRREGRGDPLSSFHDALRGLSKARGGKHVHVLFFGDSHTQGEYLPNTVREVLQSKFGDGGPGYLYAGDVAHRNDAAAQTIDGLFRIEPKAPSSPLRQGDTLFGLGGIVATPSTAVSHVTLAPRTPGRMRVDVCARSESGTGHLHVSAAQGKPDPKLEKTASHFVFDVPPPGAMDVDVGGDAALCGVVLERADEPGVVLDALGIIGARFATPLAWDEAFFTSEVTRRKPDLVVLEYGTNESAAKDLHPEQYARDASALIARIRKAAPAADCIVVGPTEIEAHADAVAVVSPALEAAAEKSGCAFWDTYHVMGGSGAMHAWRTGDVQLAQSDGIHLTAEGYKKLGTLLAADILAGANDAN
jgi:lysophospholipase L1-like esterase